MGLAYGNFTLIGSGPVVAGQTGNDRHSWNLIKIWMRLVSKNISIKPGSGTKYN